MNTPQPEIKTFNYTGGKDFTTRLLTVTGASNLSKLAQLIGVPRTTIATWHRRDMIQHEIIVRICLATGASLKYLALGEGEPFDTEQTSSDTYPDLNINSTPVLELIKDQPITKIPQFPHDGGRLITQKLKVLTKVSEFQDLAEVFDVPKSITTVVEQDHNLYFVNTLETNPTSGKYLIDIDGSLSINHLQRLPGKKLAIDFRDSTINISDSDIDIIGRIVMIIEKTNTNINYVYELI